MRIGSLVAIYFLFWAFSFFLVLPFRLQRRDDSVEGYVPGQAESAPPRFSFGRTSLWTTIVSATLFGLYYANYVHGWLPVEALDLFHGRD